MLSRIAESLYWLGRYSERAEDTARILDVHYHLLLEDRYVEEPAACAALLEVMGVGDRADSITDSVALTRLLAFDFEHVGSIVGAMEAAWENARGARETISLEMWECINSTHEALPTNVRFSSGQSPHMFFGWVKERAAMLAGLADSTMSRDDGWRFLLLGRSLERVDMTARLLSARFGQTWGASWLDHGLALLLRLRGLPPHLSTRGRCLAGRRVPRARPALPSVALPRPSQRRAVSGRARSVVPSGGFRRHRPTGVRPGPHRTRVLLGR